MKKTLSNTIAKKYFLHADDVCCRTDQPTCYFSQHGDEDGWGFWVAPDGAVSVDDTSANGELPSLRIVTACVRAAVKFLKR